MMKRDYWSTEWKRLVEAYGARPALWASDLDQPMDYLHLFTRASALAAALGRRGFGPGSRMVSRLPNLAIAPVTHIALLILGACEIPVASAASDQELNWIAEQSGAHAILSTRLPVDDMAGREVLNPGALVDDESFAFDAPSEDIGSLPGRALPSSGTTGLPKVSVYTHAARLEAHRLQCELLPRHPQAQGELLLVTPFSHGASLLALAWWHYGGLVVLHEKADALDLVTKLERGVDAFFAPPTVLHKVLEEAGGRKLRAHTIFTGTQQLDASLYHRARETFGPVIRVTYGKSECVNPICYSQPSETDLSYSTQSSSGGACCVGIPASGVFIEIRSEHGHVQASGDPGTVWVKARHMSMGTWQAGRLTEWPSGWHNTEDRGYVDEAGRLWLLGRQGDTVKTGGYLVQLEAVDAIAREIEPDVDCCAVALPSAYWGAVIALMVAGRADGFQTGLADKFEKYGRQMRPRLVLEVKQILRNPQGKVMRAALVKQVLADYKLQDGPYPALVLKRQPVP